MPRTHARQRSTILLASACGVALLGVLGVWLGLTPPHMPTSRATAKPASATEAPPSEPGREPAVELVAAADAEAPERFDARSAVRGTLIDTSTGLPLAGYTIEMRPRQDAARRALGGLADLARRDAQVTAPVRADATLALNEVLAARLATQGTSVHVASSVRMSFVHALRHVGAARDGVDTGITAANVERGADEATRDLQTLAARLAVAARDVSPERSDMAPFLVSADASEPDGDSERGSVFLGGARAPIDFRGTARDSSNALRLVAGAHVALLRGRIADVRHGSRWPRGGDGSFALPDFELGVFVEAPSTTTDAHGRFVFDCPADPDVELVLLPRERDWFDDPSLRPAGERLCSDEIVWRVERADGARVRGRVVDARTAEPLAGLTLALRGERGSADQLATDTDGRFESGTIFPAGRLEIVAHDGDDPAWIALEPGELRVPRASEPDDELVLRARLGPTLRLRFQTREVRDVDGRAVAIEQELPANEVAVRLLGARPIDLPADEPNPLERWRAVRGSDAGWVRWPRAIEWTRGGAMLESRSRDRAWTASLPIRSVGGTTDADGTIVVLERAACVAGAVRRREGTLGTGAWRVLACRSRAVESAYEVAVCDDRGAFTLQGLDAHAVRFLALVRGDELVRIEPLELAPGDSRTIELDF